MKENLKRRSSIITLSGLVGMFCLNAEAEKKTFEEEQISSTIIYNSRKLKCECYRMLQSVGLE